VGPKAGLEAVVKRKISRPYRDSNPRSFSPYTSAILLSYELNQLAFFDGFVIFADIMIRIAGG
jgi:hypothetical protein